VPSTVAYGDFNKDGLVDVATVTNPNTIIVSLAKPDGTYTVSAKLTTPGSQPIAGIYVGDYNGDGNLDIATGTYYEGNRFSRHTWLGLGDGTFGNRDTESGRIRGGW
jgi:hypothetical protein